MEIPRDLADISVNLLIPKRKIRIDGYLIAPVTTSRDLLDFFHAYFAKINDPVTQFQENAGFFVVIPAKFDKEYASFFGNPAGLWEKVRKSEDFGKEIRKFAFSEEILLRNVVKNRDFLAILGDFLNKSDLPPECVSYNFAGKLVVDYFSCKDCAIKCNFLEIPLKLKEIQGICASCKDFCHRNHEISPFLQQHEVDWGCCYCSSKGFCK